MSAKVETGRPPVALSIAGSDPSGGAGIQADLKTFSALGAYGTCVITALTSQNTRGVTGVWQVPVEFVARQLETLLDDVRIDAVKIGMLAGAELAGMVGSFVRRAPLAGLPIVLDPVMVATSGDRLLDEDAVAAVRELLPAVALVTPNVPEAAILTGLPESTDPEGMRTQAAALRELGAPRVLLKGGHAPGTRGSEPEGPLASEPEGPLASGPEETRASGRDGSNWSGTGGPDAIDLWLDDDGELVLRAPRVPTDNTHGTGCTLSSALAALRPRHTDWRAAAVEAKAWLTAALRSADVLDIGHGHGPVHHFHESPRWRAPVPPT